MRKSLAKQMTAFHMASFILLMITSFFSTNLWARGHSSDFLNAIIISADDVNKHISESQDVDSEVKDKTNADYEDPFFGSDTSLDDDIKKPSNDPLEPYNRLMFQLNISVDKAVVKPVAQGYKKVMPDPVRKSVGSFVGNLGEPLNAVNLLLQGRPTESLKSLGRFSINTITSLGFADPAASDFDLVSSDEDFGQTLGVWGVPSGVFIMLPALGPSTLRDTTGRVVDGAGSPLGYIKPKAAQHSLIVLKGINKRAKLLALEGLVDTDNYALVRDLYLEKRNFDITDRGADSSLPQPTQVEFDSSFGD